jgi:hypothetical protein
MTLRDDLFFITDIDRWALGHYILYRAATQNLPYETKDGRTTYTAAGLQILG